ncbi:ATP-dependent RecD-like DNA helicase [Streptomyces acidiscabies]|uniref:ATP-dependent RecD2 DNA helicase n=1 Tax=Streptomyces acidiscabies TaxID=42234 RepID=A0AAP6BM42_9ACTN|nr:ATP-dependent RecD-like DNA helicase [Streptomyces acidiscabies]MBZ3915267.1 ATP-dependent RecD-like DNA helicase [Streptomyces acidiscabies]MDX2967027.1 ATP-dependent RecD-like DNA helicase [Streptomyces acidiscabies]MDX3021328.1 ATP-dependent RecD-like DNA helicase [Streptomyces acidiscabies]MDX3793419.1 ATP-dependent RecD-like DNA helicase [Streptomyces acidiscabies]GAQ54863.1 ATP-dependent RecD-like DNA helicase [Streptomyces acidiscabies]
MTITQVELGEECIEGVVGHVLYISHDQTTLLRITLTADDDAPEAEVTAKGMALFGCKPGESLRLTGTWTLHPRYGRQFAARRCERTLPAGVRAIRLYLASGLIRGIGAAMAQAIVHRFADQTLHIIDTDPEQLLEVFGIGPKRLAGILEAWAEQKAVAELMVILQGLGISPNLAVKIYDHYHKAGRNPLAVVQETPYSLCREVRGIGFHTSDSIALASGVPKHSAERLQAALLAALDSSVAKGDCHLAEGDLLKRTRDLLEDNDPATGLILHDDVLGEALTVLRRIGHVVMESIPLRVREDLDTFHAVDTVSTPRMHRAETILAEHTRRLLDANQSSLNGRWEKALEALPEAGTLTSEQRRGVLGAFTHTLSVLTGGPGCGKTHTLRTVVALAGGLGLTVALAAPTGKAANRLAQMSGQEAHTVHRLLRAPEGDTLFDHSSPLASADLIVIDEASMLDVQLAAELFTKVPTGSRLLLVGDVDQLPSVGPGLVLRDLLAVPAIPRTRLTTIFRQGNDSTSIVDNAHLILNGDRPQHARGTFEMSPWQSGENIADEVVRLVRNRPTHVSLDDIQVLCHTKRRDAGIVDLNMRLQQALNPAAPDKAEHHHDGRVLRVGDKVVQTRTLREISLFNGTTGVIRSIDAEAAQLRIDFEGQELAYPFPELDGLLHAYAMTVHRAQGSEYPYVIIALPWTAPLLLTRNLLYTAVTRARLRVFLLFQQEAVQRALDNRSGNRRNTALEHRISRRITQVPAPRAEDLDRLVW